MHSYRPASIRNTNVAIRLPLAPSVSTLSLCSLTLPILNLIKLWLTSNRYFKIGYNTTELTLAVNKTTTIGPLSTGQLLQVLYRCEDTLGDIVANSFCIAGCISIDGNTENDECAQGPCTTSTVSVTVTTTTTITATPTQTGYCDTILPFPILCWGCCVPTLL
jgi:hypothetical protein